MRASIPSEARGGTLRYKNTIPKDLRVSVNATEMRDRERGAGEEEGEKGRETETETESEKQRASAWFILDNFDLRFFFSSLSLDSDSYCLTPLSSES